MKKILFLLITVVAFAQVEAPNNKDLFEADSSAYKKAEKQNVQKAYTTDKIESNKFDFKAGKLDFDKEKSELVGSQGVTASGDGLQIQADSGRVNSQTKEGVFKGNVAVNYELGKIFSDSSEFNLDTELGKFQSAEAEFDDGEYIIQAEEMKKTGDNSFDFGESIFSTCHCPDGTLPWKLTCGSSKAEIPGRASAKNVVLDFHGVPIFYSPYLFYPINVERQSGFLAPRFGYGNQDGFEINLPYFITTSDSSDILLTPFLQAKTRTGTGIELRNAFSKKSNLNGKILFSDEGVRNGELRGTNVDGLFDKVPDEQRFAGYLQQYWSSSPSSLPAYVSSDIHYVSDDLFLREFDEEYRIGQRSDQTTTSRVRLGVTPVSFWRSSVDVVYNQNLNNQSDDFVFQRYPEWRNNLAKSFKPFKNPYGLKLKTSLANTNTMFSRKEGYEGFRSIMIPKVEVPFFYKAYFDGSAALSLNQAFYNLGDESIPADASNPGQRTDISDTSRAISKFEYKMGTALEKVYESNAFFRALTGNTIFSQNEDVTAVKHIVEPLIKYIYSPKEDQTTIPIFDGSDNLRTNNLVVYGVSNTWAGKVNKGESEFSDFIQDDLFSNSINNLAQGYGTMSTFANVGSTGTMPNRKFTSRDLLGFDIKQGYYVDPDESGEEFTNVDTAIRLTPERGFGIKFDGSFDPDSGNLQAWGVGTHLKTLRGDILRFRNVFQEQEGTPNISQLEGSLEVPIMNQIRVATYGRYDEKTAGFLERKVAMRFSGSCNCWHMDVGYRDLINPNQEEFIFGLTFNGLGDLSQSVSTIRNVNTVKGN